MGLGADVSSGDAVKCWHVGKSRLIARRHRTARRRQSRGHRRGRGGGQATFIADVFDEGGLTRVLLTYTVSGREYQISFIVRMTASLTVTARLAALEYERCCDEIAKMVPFLWPPPRESI